MASGNRAPAAGALWPLSGIGPIRADVLSTRTTVLFSVLTGMALELAVQVITGRREAWDAGLYWSVGLPTAGLVSASLGYWSRGRDWVWTVAIVPSQVLVMMVSNGEMVGTLWPLTLVLSSVLSTPFVAAAFVASRFRHTR